MSGTAPASRPSSPGRDAFGGLTDNYEKLIFRNDALDLVRLMRNRSRHPLDGHALNDGVDLSVPQPRRALAALPAMTDGFVDLINMCIVSILLDREAMNGRDGAIHPAASTARLRYGSRRDRRDEPLMTSSLMAHWREAQSESSISVQDLVTSARTPDPRASPRSSAIYQSLSCKYSDISAKPQNLTGHGNAGRQERAPTGARGNPGFSQQIVAACAFKDAADRPIARCALHNHAWIADRVNGCDARSQ